MTWVLARVLTHLPSFVSQILDFIYLTLFNAVHKLLHRKVEKRYPTASSTTELTNNFADFFDRRIATVRLELSNELTSTIQSCGANEQPCHVELTEFRVVTAKEVKRFEDKIGKKSCDLDPIPASIFKECKSTVLPILTNMFYMSLQSAFFPATLKEAMIKVAQNSFQQFRRHRFRWGHYHHSLSLDATIMVPKNCPLIGKHGGIFFVAQ